MIELSGYYNGKNIYVQNPFTGTAFCVTKVFVNDQITADAIASSAIEIDLKRRGLKEGDAVKISIHHGEGCTPKVLNPEALKPRSTFEIVDIRIIPQSNSLLWEAKNEQGKLNYVAEQFRWNKWVIVNETEGTGQSGLSQYAVKVNLHFGQNRFRVKQLDYTAMARVSKIVEFSSSLPAVTFSPVKADKEITFSAETLYEIYDQFGNRLKNGFGSKIDIRSLTRGSYLLNYDNTTGNFVKVG
jgi:hypothetical protein